MEKRKITSWRVQRPHCSPFPPGPNKPVGREARGWFPATRIFDQLAYVGDANVGCYILETDDGIIQIDCMDPDDYSLGIIEDGYKELGLDIKDVKAIIITHGHGDHWGKSDVIREKSGCKIYMSKVDFEFGSINRGNGRPYINFDVDCFVEDGDVIKVGNTEVIVYSTPGHSPGGISLIFPVTDEGRPHTVALWGGTGTPRGPVKEEVIDACNTYLKSVDHFMAACVEHNADVTVSAHPFVDNGLEKMNLCRNIFDGVANPYVSSNDAVCRFMVMLRGRILRDMEQM